MTPRRPLADSELPPAIRRALVAAARAGDVITVDVYAAAEADARARGLPLDLDVRRVEHQLRAAADRGEIIRRGAMWHVPGVTPSPQAQEAPMPSPTCTEYQYRQLRPMLDSALNNTPDGISIAQLLRERPKLALLSRSRSVAASVVSGALHRMLAEGDVRAEGDGGGRRWYPAVDPRQYAPAPSQDAPEPTPEAPPEAVSGPRWVYLAAPLAGADVAVEAWHRDRAILLARQLQREHGVRCIVPHTAVRPLYDDGTQADAGLARDLGLQHSLDLMHQVGRAGGQLMVLLRDDGTMSAGCQAEVGAWKATHGPHIVVMRWPETGWHPDLAEQAAALTGEPLTLDMVRDGLSLIGLDIPQDVLADIRPEVLRRGMDAAVTHHCLACRDDDEADDPPPVPRVLQEIEVGRVHCRVAENLRAQTAMQTGRIVQLIDERDQLRDDAADLAQRLECTIAERDAAQARVIELEEADAGPDELEAVRALSDIIVSTTGWAEVDGDDDTMPQRARARVARMLDYLREIEGEAANVIQAKSELESKLTDMTAARDYYDKAHVDLLEKLAIALGLPIDAPRTIRGLLTRVEAMRAQLEQLQGATRPTSGLGELMRREASAMPAALAVIHAQAELLRQLGGAA